jgi:hypothetical protein
MENLNKTVLRRVFAPKGDGATGTWGKYVSKSFITRTFTKLSHVHQINVGGRKVWGI